MGPWLWQIGPFAWDRYGDMGNDEITFSAEPFETWRHVAWRIWRRVS